MLGAINRLSALDAALQRRAAIVEEFLRPNEEERQVLLKMDLAGISLTESQIAELAAVTGPKNGAPGWTFSDIRTRLYPAALASAFPNQALRYTHLHDVAKNMRPSPILEDL
ncbi:MAG: hypothetical protein ACXV79_04675 [Methylobacter sp.]